jgi:hypothetical protein
MDLECRDAGEGAGRSANLSREVRKGYEVVSDQGCRGRETVTGQLNPIARVAGEPNDDPLFLFNGLDGSPWPPCVQLIVRIGDDAQRAGTAATEGAASWARSSGCRGP